MSFANKGGVTVEIDIPAKEALFLVEQILWGLSRVKDWQEKQEGQRGMDLMRAVEDGDGDAIVIRSGVKHFTLCDGVTLRIIPDQRTPGSSGHGFYSTPDGNLYIPSVPLPKA